MPEIGGTPEIGADDDGFRPPGPEEQWSDSLYFGGGDGRGLALYSRIGRRPNEGRIEGALGIWLPDGRFALAFGREPDTLHRAPEDPWIAGPARFSREEPLESWTLDLCGTARVWKEAADMARSPDDHTEEPVTGRLTFSAWTPPVTFGRSVGGAVASHHYEQPGDLSGRIAVGGAEHPLEGRGLRDHSWGVRDWQAVPWWRWLGMVWDRHTFVLMSQVGRRDGDPAVGGCLMEDGRLGEIVEGSVEADTDPELGSQRSFTARAVDEHGREAVLEGTAISVAPLRQRRDRRLTIVNEALTRVRWGDREGEALSEFLVQAPSAPRE